jgi:alpha,alpha-trehalase
MFEKFSIVAVDSAGRGGEYTVQAGFGWTNGVLLWVTSLYGDVLAEPQCPDPRQSAAAQGGGDGSSDSSGGGNGSNSEGGDSNNGDNSAVSVRSQLVSVLVAVGVMSGLVVP